MAKDVRLISPAGKRSADKIRVAAYCRVSTNLADQLNSYASQIRVYTNLIRRKPEWELVEIYADEGLSGMKTDNRPEFQRMIWMCEHHQIDLILTKSVSRFARNVKETLEYVRKLKLLGGGVQFEKEGIYTLALGYEMLLNTFAAIAQEESKAISQNVHLSISKQMASGDYVASSTPYGFRRVDGALTVYEPEAETVREIFSIYLNGKSMDEIAKLLIQRNLPTKEGKWNAQGIRYILTNERYVGDSLHQKTCRETTVPFRQHRNKGQEDQYYASGTHAPIVEKEIYEKVQQLLEKRNSQFARHLENQIYPLTSHIRCSECGSILRRKTRSGGIKWVCLTHERDKNACSSGYYSEERIYDGITTIFNKLRFAEEDILGQVLARLEMVSNQYKRCNQVAMGISQSIAELNAKLLMLEQLRSKGYLAPEVFQSQTREIQQQISKMKNQRQDSFGSRILETQGQVRKLKNLLNQIEEPLDSFNEKLFKEVVTEIAINNRDEMTVTVLGGLKFTERI